jgi:hypothetical protein
MNGPQVIISIVLALVSTGIGVLLVPRARRDLWFEVMLWVGTALVAFLGSLLAIAAASSLAVVRGLTGFSLQGVPLIPAALGALGGALVLNVPLWLMNRFEEAEDSAELDAGK